MSEDVFEGINAAVQHMVKKYPGPWDIGDNAAVVCNDGIVLIEMAADRTLKIQVIAGTPDVQPIVLNLLEEEAAK
jgi:hypothetical protein